MNLNSCLKVGVVPPVNLNSCLKVRNTTCYACYGMASPVGVTAHIYSCYNGCSVPWQPGLFLGYWLVLCGADVSCYSCTTYVHLSLHTSLCILDYTHTIATGSLYICIVSPHPPSSPPPLLSLALLSPFFPSPLPFSLPWPSPIACFFLPPPLLPSPSLPSSSFPPLLVTHAHRPL